MNALEYAYDITLLEILHLTIGGCPAAQIDSHIGQIYYRMEANMQHGFDLKEFTQIAPDLH